MGSYLSDFIHFERQSAEAEENNKTDPCPVCGVVLAEKLPVMCWSVLHRLSARQAQLARNRHIASDGT